MPKNNKGVSVKDYAELNPVPSQRDLGQLILDSIRINNEDFLNKLVAKNTESELGLTNDQLREISNLLHAVGATSEERSMSQLLRYY